ncbi:hypothetical protein ABFP60_11385 [Clostridioides difficile]
MENNINRDNKKKIIKEKSILLQVDEATKGIMEEIQGGITDDIIETIEEQKRMLKEIKEKLDETYDLEKENNKLLKKVLKKIESLEEE